MSHQSTNASRFTRRSLFDRVGTGILGAALTSLLADDRYAAADEPFLAQSHPTLAPRAPHIAAQATSVIHLFMNGGPSQMDLFDPKPELERLHGKSFFDEIAGEVENPQAAGALFKSPFRFQQHGQSGLWVSDALPCLSQVVDEIAVIKSMYTTNLTHEPALFKIHSGAELPGLPTLGAWITYGLGSENQNLPAYIVMDDPRGLPVNHTQSWQAGYLSPMFQGTRFRSTGDPVLNLKRDFDEPDAITALEHELRGRLDDFHLNGRPHQPQLAARIASYELAARMQMATTDALDLGQESEATLDMYGIGKEPTDSYGRRCLYARRLVERGVRFVQLFIDFQIWDNHTGLVSGLRSACERTDQPIAALLQDLKRTGLLDRTLVVWGGEFGRLPIAQLPDNKDESNAGRDHNKNAMVSWMSGGGIKGGVAVGETDELGLRAVTDRVAVEDFHATILHQLGLHHEDLYFLRNGLRERLTGVTNPRIVSEILA